MHKILGRTRQQVAQPDEDCPCNAVMQKGRLATLFMSNIETGSTELLFVPIPEHASAISKKVGSDTADVSVPESRVRGSHQPRPQIAGGKPWPP